MLAVILGCHADPEPFTSAGGSSESASDTDAESDSTTDDSTTDDSTTGDSTEIGEDPVCGDAIVAGDEECDDGNDWNADGCTNQCTIAACGDGVIQAGEACDDGNEIDEDACTNACALPTCGNGVLDPGEECEDGNLDAADGCTTSCLFATCGDGLVWAGHEQCDDANDDDSDGCTTACESAACGDGFIQPPEQCEDGNAISNDGCFECFDQRVTAVDIGGVHVCALLDTGAVRCWGRGFQGVLGYGNEDNIGDDELPYTVGDVVVGGAVAQISSAGSHNCVLLTSGAVRCWGSGSSGNLGYPSLATVGDDELPAVAGDVNIGGSVVRVEVGYDKSCAILEGGALRCWGRGLYGQLGYGNVNDIGDDEHPYEAGDVNVGGPVVQVALGRYHTCALLEGGAVRCWGLASHGRLGYANLQNIGDDEEPADVGDVNVGGTVAQLAAGAEHTCAVLDDGALRCWGRSEYGQLGYANTTTIGDNEHPASAGTVDVGGTVVAASLGIGRTCALLDTGNVRCWGRAEEGALGYSNTQVFSQTQAPSTAGDVNVGGGIAVEALCAGGHRTCVLLATGAVRCWGQGSYGALGYGNTSNIGDTEHPVSAGNVQVF